MRERCLICTRGRRHITISGTIIQWKGTRSLRSRAKAAVRYCKFRVLKWASGPGEALAIRLRSLSYLMKSEMISCCLRMTTSKTCRGSKGYTDSPYSSRLCMPKTTTNSAWGCAYVLLMATFFQAAPRSRMGSQIFRSSNVHKQPWQILRWITQWACSKRLTSRTMTTAKLISRSKTTKAPCVNRSHKIAQVAKLGRELTGWFRWIRRSRGI